MRVLALDYGEKKVGLAISDELGLVSAKLPVLKVNKLSDKIEGIVYLLDDLRPNYILVGLPFGSNGQDTKQTKEVRKFINLLQKGLRLFFKQDRGYDIPEIVTWDESFSSQRAEKGKSKKYVKNKSDSEAARLMLQEFLDSPDGLSSIVKN